MLSIQEQLDYYVLRTDCKITCLKYQSDSDPDQIQVFLFFPLWSRGHTYMCTYTHTNRYFSFSFSFSFRFFSLGRLLRFKLMFKFKTQREESKNRRIEEMQLHKNCSVLFWFGWYVGCYQVKLATSAGREREREVLRTRIYIYMMKNVCIYMRNLTTTTNTYYLLTHLMTNQINQSIYQSINQITQMSRKRKGKGVLGWKIPEGGFGRRK